MAPRADDDDSMDGADLLRDALTLAEAIWSERGPLVVTIADPGRRAASVLAAAGARARRLAKAVLVLHEADLVPEAGIAFRAFVEHYLTTLWMLHGDLEENVARLAYDDSRSRIAIDDRKPAGVVGLSPENRASHEKQMA